MANRKSYLLTFLCVISGLLIVLLSTIQGTAIVFVALVYVPGFSFGLATFYGFKHLRVFLKWQRWLAYVCVQGLLYCGLSLLYLHVLEPAFGGNLLEDFFFVYPGFGALLSMVVVVKVLELKINCKHILAAVFIGMASSKIMAILGKYIQPDILSGFVQFAIFVLLWQAGIGFLLNKHMLKIRKDSNSDEIV